MTTAENERIATDLPLTVELKPLSIQRSSSGRVRVPSSAHLSSSSSGRVRLPSSHARSTSSGGARLPSTSHSSSSSSIYIRDPVDWNTRPDVLGRYQQYQVAGNRHSTDKRRYKTERRQRTVDRSQRTETYTPRGLTLQSHQELGPVAKVWHGSATQ